MKVIDTPERRRGDYQLSAQVRMVVVIGRLAGMKPTANHPRSPVVSNDRRLPGFRWETLGQGDGFVAKAVPPQRPQGCC